MSERHIVGNSHLVTDRGYWVVRATAPGIAPFLRHDVVAVNFHTCYDVSDATAEQIVADSRHAPVWDGARAAVRTTWARTLAQFAGDGSRRDRPPLVPEDVVLATTGPTRLVHVGTIRTGYRYREGLVRDHPHTRGVRWGGVVSYDDLAHAGSPIPKLAIPALGRLSVTPAARALIDAAATAPTAAAEPAAKPIAAASTRVGRTRASTPPSPPATPLEVPRPARGVAGRAPTWSVDEDAPVPCEKSRNRCDADGVLRHTCYRHLYRAAPASVDAAGHDLLVIAFNPNCPDTTSSRTFRNVQTLADQLGSRSITVVNLVPRRSAKPKSLDLRAVPEDRWLRNRQILTRAVADATVVVAGWGRPDITPHTRQIVERERRWLCELLDETTRRRQLPLAQFGARGAHPRMWDQLAGRTGGDFRRWLVTLDR